MTAVATRETFDRWIAARLGRLIDDADQRARILERQYPRCTYEVVGELRTRGFDATEELALRFAEHCRVATIGGELVWHKSEIDALADFLQGARKFTVGTLHRMADGISWKQDYAD